MAQIVFSSVGAAVGSHLLPKGMSVLGQTVSGAAFGQAVGGIAGAWADASLATPVEGARVETLNLMGAKEGTGIPSVYGKVRVGSQLIWASRFREEKTTLRAGGKGGPRVTDYDYSVSFAVALGEGRVGQVLRAWANGEPFDMSAVTWRFYPGDEAQQPDPLIEMIEGAGQAPAFRGTAYIVFEDLPLEAFGNRLPQLSFEMSRTPDNAPLALGDYVRAVNIIPASGEFVYATEPVREVYRPGAERTLNVNSGEGRADFLVSLDQMQADLPLVERAALTVGWFGDSVSAGSCRIRPGVELREKVTVPGWSVGGWTRSGAYLVSRNEAGAANYGGTPADFCVVRAIQALTQRGIAVTYSPFLFMDCEGFPWRGRIGVSADGTAAARAEVNAFVEGVDGFRAFILHQAGLAAEAGGVEAFLIGSEMVGLTRVRDEAGAFPFVEALCDLAAEVRAILPAAKISYAADWTEYGAYKVLDGSGDVRFPLDALWAHPEVDFIGIDWYPPTGDWRDGEVHQDALAGYRGADDLAYLQSQMAGGEAFDWYYPDDAAREPQMRVPITDGAYNEPWIWRAKDLAGWASHPHHERIGGVRQPLPTGFQAGAKPIRLCEVGYGAVDKGGNAPNLFIDPKSSESALPPFSNGERDDLLQRAALSVALDYWAASDVVEAAYVWAWDARPFPIWPLRTDLWGDGGNWARGHWLNGRVGLASLGDVVRDICLRGGVTDADTSGLVGVVEGYQWAGVSSVRSALEALASVHGFYCVERDGRLTFAMLGGGESVLLETDDCVRDSLSRTLRLLDKSPDRVRISYLEAGRDYAPALAEARRDGGDMRLVLDVKAPLVLGAARAEGLAQHVLETSRASDEAQLSLALNAAEVWPGDRVRLSGKIWQVMRVEQAGGTRDVSLRAAPLELPRARQVSDGSLSPARILAGAVDLVVIDGPSLPSSEGAGPYVAGYAEPWTGDVDIQAGASEEMMTRRTVLERSAMIGRLAAPVAAGPIGRWNNSARLLVNARADAFSSQSRLAVLNGANAGFLETDKGWELIQFAKAELVGVDLWELSDLLRGQQGSLSGAADIGARFVLIDAALVKAQVAANEEGLSLLWKAGDTGQAILLDYEANTLRPWPVCHLRVTDHKASWVRRGVDVPDAWLAADAPNSGIFMVSLDMGSGFGEPVRTGVPEYDLPEGTMAVRVAELDGAGRMGAWVSKALNTP